jgi:hypothetical protein
MKLHFTIESKNGTSNIDVDIDNLVVAGWAGRDHAAIEHHIEELAALGVPRPSAVPLFYRVSESLAFQGDHIQVVGAETSGEVETFVFTKDGKMYVSLASDHTDRKLEATGVALSKQICAKPIATTAWPFDEVADQWDGLIVRSFIVEGGQQVTYQEGALSSLRKPAELIAGYTGGSSLLPEGTGMICGTVGAIGGIRPSRNLTLELFDPVLNRSIRHDYVTEVLPEVA